MKAAERKPSISSLNPSTSRFTLRLPLLGRPKVPLEQAVAVAQSEDIREPPTTEDTTISRDDQMNAVSDEAPTPPAITDVNQELLPTAEHAPEQPHTTTNNEPATLKSTSAPSEDDNKSHDPRAASWWDYIGWSGGHAEAHPKAAEDGPAPSDGQLVAEADSLPTTADAAQPHSEEQVSSDARAVETNVESGSQSVPSEAHTGGVKQSDGVETAKPSSIFSAETAKSHGSVWYSPWAWYGTSPTVTSGTQEHSSEVSSDPITADQKTDSEMVKEEALARAQNETTNPSPTQADQPSSSLDNSANDATPTQIESTPKTASPELQNPLETSIADNRSGWMSFFMSKALVTKAVTNESHDAKDDGMEVMEIDEEPQPSSAIEIPIGKDVQRAAASSSLKSSSPALSSPLPSPAPKSPSGKSPVSPLPKEKEPKKPEPPAAPLTDNESIKRETVKGEARSASPTPSKASGTSPPNSARAAPNFVLPTWEDTFLSPPRSYAPPRHPGAKSKLTGALSYVAGAFFTKDERVQGKGKGKSRGKGKEREAQTPAPEFLTFGQDLPKAFDVLGEQLNPYMLNGGCRVVVIGVAGWSPGAVTRTLAGGLPSSSSKFVDMTSRALEQFAEENGFKFKKISRMPLEGDGTIRKKVSRVYNHLVNNEEWMEDLHAADVIFVASHSQGAIISTHLVDRLIEDGHILTSRSVDTLARSAAAIAAGGAASVPTTQAQKVCLLALCGIHLGPLRYLKTSSLLQPYIQYVENAAARELFEFQDTESKLSKNYIGALRNVMDHGAKVVYVASLNDQVVPIYSGLFTAASHPRILRALYIDNDAYHSSDFLSNLLILLIRIMNAGLSDRGLLAHLSEATAGTLSGVGHSTAYEEPATYSLAVKYFFMTNDGTNADAELVINPFNAVEEQNDYEIPWLLRDMIADNKIAHFFAQEFSQLRDAFDDWQPKTTILRDVKKKLQPITRLSTLQLPNTSISKL
ncbi:hypothetical protein C8Q78DRAFT_986317 [Trametes maxima]|nr:hypothetical protein C8Q78DRAFT_986317 [Trametes maxima]